jgi:hypothetical protein
MGNLIVTEPQDSKNLVGSMKRTAIVILFIAALGLPAPAQDPKSPIQSKPKRIVTAAQVNGTYRFSKSEFRIMALGNKKLKVQFDGIYMTLSGSPNMGYAAGEATIEGNVATLLSPDYPACKITMVFLPKNRMEVSQEGSDADCGFGHNVHADGTYRKVRGGKPKFEVPP